MLLPLATVAWIGCAPDKPVNDAPVLVGRGADAIALDPARVTDAESSEVTEQIFDHLVRYKPDSPEIEPSLAESWDESPDGRTWTFHLRKNVRFHDGTPFDADAVVFSFDRQRDPHHPYHQPDFTYWENNFRNIQSVEAVDPYTVRITIERPFAPFLSNLATFPVSIVSPSAVRKWGAEFARHPVGTGPVPLRRVVAGRAHHARGQPATTGAARPRSSTSCSSSSAIRASGWWRSRAAPSTSPRTLSPEDLQFVALHPELKLLHVAANNVGYLAMNTHAPAVRRRARAPRGQLRDQQDGAGEADLSGARPRRRRRRCRRRLWSHVDEELYHYDRAEAMRAARRGALRASRQKRPKLYVMDTQRPYMPAPETVARIIQHNLRDVGMDVEIVVNDFDTHVRLTQNGVHDLCLLGWSADTMRSRQLPVRAVRPGERRAGRRRATSPSSRTPSCTASCRGRRSRRIAPSASASTARRRTSSRARRRGCRWPTARSWWRRAPT